MKEKIKKGYLRRTRKLLETKLHSRNFIKGINTCDIPLGRYSGLFLKWTRKELQQMDQRTRKLMKMHKSLHPRDDCDAAWNIYPKTGVYFSHVSSRGSLVLDPSQNKFQLRFLLRAHGELADNVGVNLGQDWPPLARDFHISRYTHTHTRPLPLPTPRIMENMGL